MFFLSSSLWMSHCFLVLFILDRLPHARFGFCVTGMDQSTAFFATPSDSGTPYLHVYTNRHPCSMLRLIFPPTKVKVFCPSVLDLTEQARPMYLNPIYSYPHPHLFNPPPPLQHAPRIRTSCPLSSLFMLYLLHSMYPFCPSPTPPCCIYTCTRSLCFAL